MSHGPGRWGIRFFDAPTVGDARGRGRRGARGAGKCEVVRRPCSRNRPRSRKRPLSEESHVANDSARTILLPVTADAYVVFHFRNLTLHLPSRTARQGHPAPLRCPPNHSQRAFFQITPPLPDSASLSPAPALPPRPRGFPRLPCRLSRTTPPLPGPAARSRSVPLRCAFRAARTRATPWRILIVPPHGVPPHGGMACASALRSCPYACGPRPARPAPQRRIPRRTAARHAPKKGSRWLTQTR